MEAYRKIFGRLTLDVWLRRGAITAIIAVHSCVIAATAALAQTRYVLYAVSHGGIIYQVDESNGGASKIVSSLGSYTDFEGISYYNGFFYLVTSSGNLLKFERSTSQLTYIGNTGYFLRDIAIRPDGAAYVLLSSNSDSQAESIATINLTTAGISGIIPIQSISPVYVSNLGGLGFDPLGTLRAVGRASSSTYSSWFMQIDPATGVYSPKFEASEMPYFLRNYAYNSIAVHPSTGRIYAIALTGSGNSLYELFEPSTANGVRYSGIGSFGNLDPTPVRGATFGPAGDVNPAPLVQYLLDDL